MSVCQRPVNTHSICWLFYFRLPLKVIVVLSLNYLIREWHFRDQHDLPSGNLLSSVLLQGQHGRIDQI